MHPHSDGDLYQCSIRFVARDKDAVRLHVHAHVVRILVSSPNSVSRTLLASTEVSATFSAVIPGGTLFTGLSSYSTILLGERASEQATVERKRQTQIYTFGSDRMEKSSGGQLALLHLVLLLAVLRQGE